MLKLPKFGKSKRPQMTDPTSDLVAAYPGYQLFVFNPPPETKLSMPVLQELLRGPMLQPIVGWRHVNGRLEPMSIFALPAGADRYLFAPNNKIFAIDHPAQLSWATLDAFAVWLFDEWKKRRGEREPQPYSFIPARRDTAAVHA
jgi:hypothetical protein